MLSLLPPDIEIFPYNIVRIKVNKLDCSLDSCPKAQFWCPAEEVNNSCTLIKLSLLLHLMKSNLKKGVCMTNMNAGLWALSTLPKYPSCIMVLASFPGLHSLDRIRDLLLAFTVPWWTTGGIRYGSPRCPVVVGCYSSFIPSAWYA